MAHLRIDKRLVGAVAILDLDGRLVMGDHSSEFREAIRMLLTEGHKEILVNLRDVDYVDSSGLGELVSAYSTAKRADARLKLLNLTTRVHGLLQMTKLLTVFEAFDTEDTAVRSFETDAATPTPG